MLHPDDLATIEAALSAAWQLAEIAGDWNLEEVEIDGEMVSVYDLQHMFTAAKNDLRVRALAAQDATPAPPQGELPAPDWASAPPWAKFYAVNSGGVEVYFECEPIRYDRDGFWDAPMDPNNRGRVLGARWQGDEIDLPIGVDWRATLQPRPALDAGGA